MKENDIQQHHLDKMVTMYNVEHTFIDFTCLIINEKIKALSSGTNQPLSFDDKYIATLFHNLGCMNKKMYEQDSIQKVIECQWDTTRRIMSISTAVYVLFYFIPVSYVLITDEGKHHIESLCVASVPAMILLVIEIYQIREQGKEYFRGWNVGDLL